MELPDPRNPAHSKDRPETIPADLLGSRADQESRHDVDRRTRGCQRDPDVLSGVGDREGAFRGDRTWLAQCWSRIKNCVAFRRLPAREQRIDYRRLALAFLRRWILASIVGSLAGHRHGSDHLGRGSRGQVHSHRPASSGCGATHVHVQDAGGNHGLCDVPPNTTRPAKESAGDRCGSAFE